MIAANGPSLCDLPRWAVKRRGQLPMPLDPKVLNSVVRISTAGDLQGTGFIVGVPSDVIRGRVWPYLVTAHHVIRHQVEVAIEVPDPLTYGELFDPVPVEDWSQPFDDVDLAIARFPFDDVPRYQAFPTTHFLPEGSVVPLGGPVYYLGMFAPLDVPMGRAGTLGALDVPVSSKLGYSYRGDLVDCRSYDGFSGSPCIATLTYVVWDSHATDLPPGAVPSHVELGTTATVGRFCGMFTSHYDDDNDEGAVSRYGVGVMLPSDTILAALMTDEMKEERRVDDQEHLAKREADQPPLKEAAIEPAQVDEWSRFEDLSRRLVQVPKSEIDDKRDD